MVTSWKTMAKVKRRRLCDGSSGSDLPNEVKGLGNEMRSMREIGEDLTKRIEKLESQIRSFPNDLQQEIRALKDEANVLIPQLKEIERLQKKVQDLEEEIKTLKRTLELGQVMMEFERNVSKFFVRSYTNVGRNGGIKFMLDCLNRKTRKLNEEQFNELKQRWTTFQTRMHAKYNLKDLKTVLSVVLKKRHVVGHPDINYERAYEQVKELVPQYDEECLEIFKMHKELNHILVLGAYARNFESEIISYIFEPTYRVKTLSDVVKWFTRNKSSTAWKGANERWNDLTQKKQWTDDHEKALKEIEEYRQDECLLHPIDFEEGKKHIAGYVSLKSECFDIINMMKRFSQITGKTWELPENK